MKYKIVYQENRKVNTIILEATDLEQLKQHNDFPFNIIKIKEIKAINSDIFSSKNPKKEVYEFFVQLDMMLSANLTFSQSIDLLLESGQDKKIEEVLNVIQQSLSTSLSLDKALSSYTRYLGKTSVLFLKLGFENGNIKESIHSLVEILDEDIKSSEKLREVMRYPLILICSLFISIGMIFIYVLPNFEFIFTLLKDDIPLSTTLLIWIKNFMDKYWSITIIGLGVFTLFFLFLIQKNRYRYDKIILLKIPIFSKVLRDYYFYRLFLSLSIIVKSKYQFQIALENSKNIVSNLYVKEIIENILISLKNGITISEAFEKSSLFDSLTIKMLSTADNTNKHEHILVDITAQYKKRFHKSLKNFSSAIEPILIFIISLVVLWLILAIMLPIWNLGAVIN